MPKLNGFETCKQIRKRAWGENVTIVALTGWGQEADRLKSAEAGFDEHLVKPVDLAKLVDLLNKKSGQVRRSA
jgi:DNA-binding response OmpR family regulator